MGCLALTTQWNFRLKCVLCLLYVSLMPLFGDTQTLYLQCLQLGSRFSVPLSLSGDQSTNAYHTLLLCFHTLLCMCDVAHGVLCLRLIMGEVVQAEWQCMLFVLCLDQTTLPEREVLYNNTSLSGSVVQGVYTCLYSHIINLTIILTLRYKNL